LLAASHVKENPEHNSTNDAAFCTLSASGNPSDFVAQAIAKIDFERALNGAGGGEGCPDAITVGRMNVSGQFLKGDLRRPRKAPKFERALVHRKSVVVYLPRPKRHAGCFDGKPQVIFAPL
jgi:hypothetical protein